LAYALSEMEDDKDASLLSFQKFLTFYNTYITLPTVQHSQLNNSDNFKSTQVVFDHMNFHELPKQARSIVSYVHLRIEEKFGSYRAAFRYFDKNYDGLI
jgi:Ca2+-binding EF-hand superfamily protein